MKKLDTKLFIAGLNIFVASLIFTNGKLIYIDAIWIQFLTLLLLIWNILLFYMLQKNKT
ncbi:hypothetical protein [Flavobacterium anhuiense]|uniref:hypothetical protein n=1 Tax=Flavobacterium anhuiense TaxID=459526 RepID=UPI003D95AE26